MEILVVTSKVKGWIKEKSQMNTSGEVPNELTNHVQKICAMAIECAKADGRKTVMARDIQGALNTFVDGGGQ